jgi:hypothetical protein
MFLPVKNSRCAVVIPYYTNSPKSIELFCLTHSLEVLDDSHDVYFLCPIGLEVPVQYQQYNIVRISANHLSSVEAYCRWLLEREPYEFFLSYDYMLILQFDAILVRNELSFWSRQGYDFIGAPWFDHLIFRPTFKSSKWPVSQNKFLEVGNGGFCLINPRSFLYLQTKYSDAFSEFSTYTGPSAGQEALYAYLCREDPALTIAPAEVAAKFSLELDARDAILRQKMLPMGFHALYKYDLDLWYHLFPTSPRLG